MDFTLTEDRRMLADSLARFLADKCTAEHRAEIAYKAPYHDPALWSGLAEMGIAGAMFPEGAGGFGGAGFDLAVVFETLGRALCPEPMLGLAMAGAVLGAEDPLAGPALAGEAPLAFGLWELDDELQSCVRGGKLSGRKSVVYGGQAAAHLLVSARDEAGEEGLYAVAAADAQVTPYAMIDGGGAAEIVFDESPCRKIGGGDCIARAREAGIVALCAEAVGVMDALLDQTTEYLKTRQQFGQAIGKFQALQHRLVDMAVECEQARSITILAAASLGTPEAARHTSMAKNLIGRAGQQIAEEAIQMHGGIAMTWEAPVSHYAKRLTMIDAQLGDRDDHIAQLVAMG